MHIYRVHRRLSIGKGDSHVQAVEGRAGPRRRSGTLGPTMTARHTLLIANGQPHLRQLVRRTLASVAYLVLEAGDGDEAWVILQVCLPDVTVLGVEMQGRDGLALTRAIRPSLSSTTLG
jgi:PleD family two-component response regulator